MYFVLEVTGEESFSLIPRKRKDPSVSVIAYCLLRQEVL